VDALVRAARSRGDLVVWVLHSEPGSGTVFDPPSGHVRLMDGLAADLGYRVEFVTDATASFPIPHRDAPADRPLADLLADPTTLGVDEIVARTEYALAGRFATIRSVQEVVTA
jgi:hypothetical protein